MDQGPPVHLVTTNTLEKKPAPPEDDSITPLASSSSTSFWIMGWWAAAALILKHLKLQNKRWQDLCWRWWSITILSTNLLEVILLHWSKNWWSVPTCTTEEEDDMETVDCNTSGMPTPMTAHLPRVSRTGRDTTTSRLSANLISLSPTLQAGLLCQGPSSTSLFCILKWNPVLGPALPPLIWGKDWDKSMEDCCQATSRNQFILS